jgi:predicted TIM-barrel fold metal-dependent hydrolase
MVIDVHAHAFPDDLAQRAVSTLSGQAGMHPPDLDGTIAALLRSMDDCGIKSAFIANIATKPHHAETILTWSKTIRTERVLPLGSVHPRSSQWEHELESLVRSGLPGLKLHPLYQGFEADDESLFPFYRRVSELGLFILFHAGYDLAFAGDDKAAPKRLARVHLRIPELTMILAHLGGWKAWDDVEAALVGSNVYFDTSFMHDAPRAQQERILRNHSMSRILFGSDSPWTSQRKSLEHVRSFGLSAEDYSKILDANARGLYKNSFFSTLRTSAKEY